MFKIFNTEIDTFGLDLSSPRSIRIAKVANRKNELQLTCLAKKDIGLETIKGDKIKNQEDFSLAIREITKKEIQEKSLPSYATISVPEKSCFLKTVEIPFMKKEDLDSAVFYEAENQFPFSAEELYIDYGIISKSRKSEKIDVLMVASLKSTLDLYIKAVEEAGFTSYMVEGSPFSIVRALVKQKEEGPVFLIDINSDRATYVIYFKNCIRFTTSLDRKVANNSGNEDVNYLEEAVSKAAECLEYYGKNYQDEKELKKIIVSGSREIKEELIKKLSLKTETKVLPGNALSKIDKNLTSSLNDVSSYTSAIGVMLKSFFDN